MPKGHRPWLLTPGNGRIKDQLRVIAVLAALNQANVYLATFPPTPPKEVF